MPDITGPGASDPPNSAANRQPSDPGRKDSATKAPTPAPPVEMASNTGDENGAAKALSLAVATPFSIAPKVLMLLGPKEGSKPTLPEKNGLPAADLTAAAN